MPIIEGLLLMWKEARGGYKPAPRAQATSYVEAHEFNKIREYLDMVSLLGPLGANQDQIYNACILFGQANFYGENRPTIEQVVEFINHTLNLDYTLYRDSAGVLRCEERE